MSTFTGRSTDAAGGRTWSCGCRTVVVRTPAGEPTGGLSESHTYGHEGRVSLEGKHTPRTPNSGFVLSTTLTRSVGTLNAVPLDSDPTRQRYLNG